jgi:hypothetical protein
LAGADLRVDAQLVEQRRMRLRTTRRLSQSNPGVKYAEPHRLNPE